MAGVSAFYATMSAGISVVSAVGWALLILGIVRLASPPHGERRVDPSRFQ